MARQTIENLRGEVQFRRKLFEQQVQGIPLFDDEFDASGIEAVLRDRMAATLRDMHGLAQRGVVTSPYLELGAERGQRALVIENELGWRGAALDISQDLLRSCQHYARRFAYEHLPLRICGNAYRLPFRSGSLPFVFCYQTLHHFPDPEPILEEIDRVLAPGGVFMFAEEPYARVLHWDLYEVQGGACSREQRGTVRRVVDRFFGKARLNEEEHGVIENHDIPLREWDRLFAGFAESRFRLDVAGRLEADMSRRFSVKYLVAYLLGGNIAGVCQKAGALRDYASSVQEALISPADLDQGHEVPLVREADRYRSGTGGTEYPVIDDIAFLLEESTMTELYPELRH
ncbi:MAG: class I SAM-dependent methyltransferase [Gemmatimonadota bacterium]